MDYLRLISNRYKTTPIELLPLSPAYLSITPILRQWASQYLLLIKISGSNAKRTAVVGVADLDLFVSLHHNILTTTRHTLSSIYQSLTRKMEVSGYKFREQNVSIRVNHAGVEVDIVPGVKYIGNSSDHWLHVRKSRQDRTKTNIDLHISKVLQSGRIDEILLTKIWRKLHGLDFPSIYLELTVIKCLF